MSIDIMLTYKVVNEDERGEISVLFDPVEEDNKEIAILRTNKGFVRGGCVHNLNDEIVLVVKGKVQYHIITKWKKKNPNTLIDGEDHVQILVGGDKILVPKGKPHYYISLTDSIVIEFGATTPEKQKKHPEIREMVERLNRGNVDRIKRDSMK